MPDPNFLVIGAQKAGTTWLCNVLRQHPDVFVPAKKELNFFNKEQNYSKGLEWYQQLFSGHSNQKALGEFTPNYFWTSDSETEFQANDWNQDIPKLVYSHYPQIKLIISLRNPVSRAVSAYYHHIRGRRVSPRDSILDVMDKYGILSMGFYYTHLERWLQFFPIEQFLLLIYEEDIVINKEETLKKIYQFINVDDSFKSSILESRFNARDNHLYMRLNYYSPPLAEKISNLSLPAAFVNSSIWNIPVTAAEKETLANIYAEQNHKLSFYLQRSLPW
jgi:hypothetical protein